MEDEESDIQGEEMRNCVRLPNPRLQPQPCTRMFSSLEWWQGYKVDVGLGWVDTRQTQTWKELLLAFRRQKSGRLNYTLKTSSTCKAVHYQEVLFSTVEYESESLLGSYSKHLCIHLWHTVWINSEQKLKTLEWLKSLFELISFWSD